MLCRAWGQVNESWGLGASPKRFLAYKSPIALTIRSERLTGLFSTVTG
jgi:hypothetical protein